MGTDAPKAVGAVAPHPIGTTRQAGRHVIKILGKGCGSCIWTERLVREVVAAGGADVDIEKVTKTSEMVPYGVRSTPAIIIDERVVHSGGIPTKEEVQRWVRELLP